MPILKQSSSHTKKRTRIDREMISAPLGDFRHTMHVGRGGDVFGDTSFLSNHGPSSAPSVEAPTSKKNGIMKLAGPGDHEEGKMADSLSQRSQSSGIGSGAGSVSSSPVNNVSTKEDSLWNSSCAGGNADQFDWPGSNCGMKHAESILSFHLDLGPSILDEVLGVMDRDPPASEWSSPDDKRDLGFKFSSVIATDNDKHTQSSSVVEPQGNHFSLPSTLPNTNLDLDYNSSSNSQNPEENGSVEEEDSEEDEKRSIYEGIADSQEQNESSLHIRHRTELEEDEDDDDEEEAGQSYTFDEDLDDEIGV